ncbi:DciA family protein [Streptomyces sp. NPDC059740]|uniref:DciA family protein n=1 Tax=Streptomyces sp. NPDC059740 TaxID=3346926 RepID=UPI003654E81A
MTDTPMSPTATGADLARQAFRAARVASKQQPPSRKERVKRMRKDQKRLGDPLAFSDVLDQLAAANGWEKPSAGGQITARWHRVAPPEYAGLAAPERYDAETQTLHLRPVTTAAATKLRWDGPKLAAALNAAVGDGTVKQVRVLAPGPASWTTDGAAPEDDAPRRLEELPVKTRADASPGFHLAIEAHLEHAVHDHDRTELARLIRALADRPPAIREPEEAFRAAMWEKADAEEAARHDEDRAERVRARALAAARAAKAGRAPAVPTAFQRTA